MNGGYALINCTGLDLNDLGKVDGLYQAIKNAVKTEKPIVLHGIVNGSQAFTDITGYGGIESETSVFVSFFPVTIHVSNADVVTME